MYILDWFDVLFFVIYYIYNKKYIILSAVASDFLTPLFQQTQINNNKKI